MSNKYTDEVLIDKFLRQELNDEEQSLFDRRLEDPAFKKVLEETKEIQAGLVASGQAKLKSTLAKIESEIVKEQPVNRIISIRKIATIAASVGFLGLLLWMLMPRQTDSEGLYATYYDPFPNIVDPIVKGDTVSGISVYRLFEQGEYKAALDLLEKQEQFSDVDRMYQSLCHVAFEQCNLAQESLDFMSNTSSEYRQIGDWYLALCHLKGNKAESKLILQRIAKNPDHVYYSKATEVLDHLE